MKYLIYDLFSGVGFCNQLFSLETAIYLASITKRKLILFIKNPLCHCGKASWEYGKFMDFFADDYKNYLPEGIEVYYKILPEEYKFNNNLKESYKFSPKNKFSNCVLIDRSLKNNKEDILKFCKRREYLENNLDEVSQKFLYINTSNASRCFYNFYTSKRNYHLMGKICYSLMKLNLKFEKSTTNYDLSIHLRLGDHHHNTERINDQSLVYSNTLLRNIEKLVGVKKILLMCDRKDGLLIKMIQDKYDVTFTDTLINKSNNLVKDFLQEKELCLTSKYFIGTQGSTVSNYINYQFYNQNKTFNLYNKRIFKFKEDNYSWDLNNIEGHPISWSIFWKDNIPKLNSLITRKEETVKYKNFYIKILNEINISLNKNKKIISYCLYGLNSDRNKKRNFDKGVYVNYWLMKNLYYKDWIMRVYIPEEEPDYIINYLQKFKDIEIIIVKTNICLRTLRFLPNDDPNVSIWISRDLDSLLNKREEIAVLDWIHNYINKELMIMSDNTQHTWTIAGGMFGKRNNNLRNFSKFVLKYSADNLKNQNKFANDCEIAEQYFYKKDNYIQYYRLGKKLEFSKSFPNLDPIPSQFVGNISNLQREYEKLKIEEKFPFLKKDKILKDGDLFLYKPWSSLTNKLEPICKVKWEGDDIVIKLENNYLKNKKGILKSQNNQGIKLLDSFGTKIKVLWDNVGYREIYVSDPNTIKVLHNEKSYDFIRY